MSDLTVWTIPEEALHADLRAVLEAWGGREITLRRQCFCSAVHEHVKPLEEV